MASRTCASLARPANLLIFVLTPQNLGLGVLEEKDSNAENNESRSPNSESDGGEEGAHTQEKDIMGKLMGRDKPEAVGIQEVTDTQHDT